MFKRTATAAAFVLALGGTGAALAANGADDPAGHHHHHGKADDHGRKGTEPGDDNGGDR